MKNLAASSGWPAPKSSPANSGPNELCAAPGRSVRDQDRVTHHAAGVFRRFADRPVVKLQLGQRLARGEFEIADDVIGFGGWGIFGGAKSGDGKDEDEKRSKPRVHAGKPSGKFRGAHAPRVLAMAPSPSRTLLRTKGKIVSARRRNQHARRVRSPDMEHDNEINRNDASS